MIGLVGGSTTLARCGRQCCLAAQGEPALAILRAL